MASDSPDGPPKTPEKDPKPGLGATLEHPLLKLIGLIIAVFLAALGFREWQDNWRQEIETSVKTALATTLAEDAKQAARDEVQLLKARGDLVPVHGTLETVFVTPADGAANGDVSALSEAIVQGRDIYVSYIRESGGTSHRWFRRCDHMVIDNVSGAESSVTCFARRLPDTNFVAADGQRQLTDPTIFEDHIIHSDGRYFVRKYQIADGMMIDLTPPEGARGEYRAVKWQAVRYRSPAEP